jgi:hypothetical protein
VNYVLKSLRAQTAALLTVVALGAALPAQADDAKGMATNALLFPVRAASVATGLVVGIPVAMIRRTSNRCIEFTDNFADKIGGHEHGPPCVFGAVLGMPFGLLVGSGEGVFYGGKNAFCNSVDKPFSLATMSLDTELDANSH